MIIEAALGDAYASHFDKQHNIRIKEFNVPGKYVPDELKYSALTQMLCATTKLVTDKPDFNTLDIAQALVEAHGNSKRNGYDVRLSRALRTAHETGDAGHAIVSKEKNIYSGAAVRAIPLGFYDDPDDVIAKCAIQSSITNLQSDVVDSSCIAGLIAYLFLENGKRSDIPEFLADVYPRMKSLDWSKWHGPVPKNSDLNSVMAALTVIQDNDTLSSCLEAAISFGGHTGAVATIAMGLGSMCLEIENDLSSVCQSLLDRFEQSEECFDNLGFLDYKLVDMGK